MTSLGWPGWAYVATCCGLVPWMAARLQRALDSGAIDMPPRGSLLASVAVQQVAIAALALGVAWAEGVSLTAAPPPAARAWLAAGALLAVALGTVPLRWRLASAATRERLRSLLPAGPRDWPAWILVSLLAGVGEELAYRGVLFSLLERVTGSWLAAVAVASTAFALAHAIQGWRSVAVIFFLAWALHAIVLLSGSLLPAMVVHAAYDAVAGLAYGRLAARDAAAAAADDGAVASR